MPVRRIPWPTGAVFVVMAAVNLWAAPTRT